MNRRIVFLFILCVVLAAGVFGQSDTSLLNTNRYLSYFSIKRKEEIADNDYLWKAADNEILTFGSLNWNGKEGDITGIVDTPVEFALLSYYSQPVIQSRPVEADTMLPKNNPELAVKKLCAALYQDILVFRFLGDTNATARHEGMLKFLCDENGVTRTEIENYFRTGIRNLVSEIVNEEFNKISFMLDRKYGVVLTRNPQNGHYTLSYEQPILANDDKTLSGQTLEILLSAMRNSKDFSQSAINTVRDQMSQRIPAVVYADWHAKGVARGADAMKILVDTLTEFYLNPNRENYEIVRGIYARYRLLGVTHDPLADAAVNSYQETLISLSDSLYTRVTRDANPSTITEMAKIPASAALNVFTTRYITGAER